MRTASLLLLAACTGGGDAIPDAAISDTAVSDTPADTAAACPPATAVDIATASELVVAGDVGSTLGIFDPSYVYPGDAPAGVLAYSAVPDQESIRTRLAVSSDHGATWTFIAEPNAPEPATIASSDPVACPGGACTGKLISEVSSLVFDADDPDPSRRWKLFAHRYLVGAGVALHYDIGTIALQTAADPHGPWSAPSKLIGWPSSSPFSSQGTVVNTPALGMADCIALTEPGALWLPGSLQLAVGCVSIDAGVPRIRIELLRSTDHAASWQHLTTLLRPEDAGCTTPGASINAADLFTANGREYITATPSDDSGYHGCLVFEIDDLATGHVARPAVRSLVPSPAGFSGACTFADGVPGYAMIVGRFDQARRFRIYRTGVTAP